ncbi:carbamoyl-phosphate synthase L chain, ATP binding domain-containing protein [Zychaea mexicana]|uniref:carbamoyl-phosphate synthase L chain, ATP binding domain-containing protein n=1 Tax=Zychaea mexicana TaxID=64656 RepID=UPI0022FE40E4|nr:carbamoyl-phosphate synthase L chain, ATP binding domain-containing protein [Zychaea mexicana]KAI9491700.1 carbamoyl-phosphate synthase L chain, ATP binding domain-containing protein [Zychaea mexicana]
MTKLLVANRGEIAIRALTAAAELGLQTVAVYSDEHDKSHCGFADQVVKLKSPGAFLDPQQIIDAAKSAQANAVHPGYGFLSESVELAEQCKQANILFVGPSSSCIAAVGDKVSARQVAKQANVPVIPGTEESISDPAQVHAFAQEYGYPVMLKARDGGGGRGIRMVHSQQEVADALQRCISESPSKQVFVEKAIIGAKHIEVQILGDRHGNLIHLLERDCSAQRRYQKIIEVAPCPSLSNELRAQIHSSAARLGKHIRYDSVGTVEFLVQADQNAFYFLEVNPRIQVEHTITEQITNVDLVQSQIRVALGERLDQLGLSQASIPLNPSLVAIQARVVAENPRNNNMLSVGKVTGAHFPQGHGIRVDTWVTPGCVVLPTFDSLLAKVIVTGQSFPDAVSKVKLALQRTDITGVETNLDFLSALVSSNEMANNVMKAIHIKTLEEQMDVLLDASTVFTRERQSRKSAANAADGKDSKLVAVAPTSVTFRPGDAFNIEVGDAKDKAGTLQAHTLQIDSISTNNFPEEFVAEVQTSLTSQPIAISVGRKSALGSKLRRKASPRNAAEIATPITGMVVEVNVEEGDQVEVGQQVFVMSAMKMETVVKATLAGRVQGIYAKANDLVEAGDLVLETSETKESKL